ncbi:endonuclease/exonuclease/phosphatase family protein [Streptomyces sp. NPDC088747]|uniref:endonuclease/exonuclease/phosphatase family protein n=1 Tax=Streptomyces sp. NPDC088747 TaxID=3365886 RepID=UPI003807E2DE
MSRAHSTHREPVITVITFNLERDGGPDEIGRPPARWRYAHQLLKTHRPDVLLRQEMTYSRANGQRRLHDAERLLGMRGFNGAPGSGNNPTGLFVRPDAFDVHQQVDNAPLWRTPPTHIVASLREVPDVPIVMMSWHLAFNSPRGREHETDEILAAADKTSQGMAFLGGGDMNEYPHPAGERVPPIDWTDDGITDRMHVMHRTNRSPDGARISCTYADETLLGAGLHDPARYAAHTLDQPDALCATAGQNKPSQGGPRRIDRVYNDPWLITAVLEVSVIDTPYSDHDGLKVVYSRAGMAEALRRKRAPQAAYNLAF